MMSVFTRQKPRVCAAGGSERDRHGFDHDGGSGGSLQVGYVGGLCRRHRSSPEYRDRPRCQLLSSWMSSSELRLKCRLHRPSSSNHVHEERMLLNRICKSTGKATRVANKAKETILLRTMKRQHPMQHSIKHRNCVF